MDSYYIDKKDLISNYFHFTKESNINSIKKMDYYLKYHFMLNLLKILKKYFLLRD